jgi:glucokinase
MDGMAKPCIGIDIGGTKMAVALVNDQGAVLKHEVLLTEAEHGFARAVDRLSGSASKLMAQSGVPEIGGIGIGCAGPVDPIRGLINNPYTLTGWNRCDIVRPLQDRFGCAVHLENDADVAVVGEWQFGIGRGLNPVVMLTFGTGIGGGAMVHGEIYRGVNGEHPELGHMPATWEGPECYCGIRGCLESVASGTAIGAAGRSLGLEDARAVFAAESQGHVEARAIIARAREAAATAIWTLCHTFLPQRIILGGGMMEEQFDLFAETMLVRLAKATQFPVGQVSLRRATLGAAAGVVGAAALALQRACVSASENA